MKVFHMLYDSTIGKTKKQIENNSEIHFANMQLWLIDTCLKTCILLKNAGDPKLEETKAAKKEGLKGEIWKESS